MPEEQQPELNRPAPQKNLGGRRRGHRGGRSRSRGPRQTPDPAAAEKIGVPAPQPEKIQTVSANESASAVSKATDDVRRIVESLEQALEQMEEVLELVEVAERQKFSDEREIESLRRALRRIQPPREIRDKSQDVG